MIPAITAVRMSGAGRKELPVLVLGPSLGTSATVLWSHCAADLIGSFDVIAWDLPGHGHNRSVLDEDVAIADLAAGVLAVVDDILDQRGEHGGSFFVAGDSVGGATALHLLLDAPSRVAAAATLCAGARFATPQSWLDRIETVAASGTSALIPTLSQRWFGPGFVDRSPEVVSALLHDVQGTDDAGYIAVCRALASYDVSSRLAEISAPLLVVAGAEDRTDPPARDLTGGVTGSRFVELSGVGHLAPAEAPADVARLLREHFLGEHGLGEDGLGEDGLGEDGHGEPFVEGAAEAGQILDGRSRWLITLTALVARGHHDGVAPALREAITHGVTLGEFEELIQHTAISCEVPDALAAQEIARDVFAE